MISANQTTFQHYIADDINIIVFVDVHKTKVLRILPKINRQLCSEMN